MDKYSVRTVADFLAAWEEFQEENPGADPEEYGFGAPGEDTDDDYDLTFFPFEDDDDLDLDDESDDDE